MASAGSGAGIRAHFTVIGSKRDDEDVRAEYENPGGEDQFDPWDPAQRYEPDDTGGRPLTESQRRTSDSRMTMVLVVIANTAAIPIASTVRKRMTHPATKCPHLGGGLLSAGQDEPARDRTCGEELAMSSSPLPRNTVPKNRSSLCPIRSRTTPTNQKKGNAPRRAAGSEQGPAHPVIASLAS